MKVISEYECSVCGGTLHTDAEGEKACVKCGAVKVDEELPVDINPWNRSPENNGVLGKNLGTCNRESYNELRVKGIVSGAMSGWDLDSITEKDPVVRDEIMWFTNLALRLGIGDINIDPLARTIRAILKQIKSDEEREMQNRVRTRFLSYRDEYEGIIKRSKREERVLQFLEKKSN